MEETRYTKFTYVGPILLFVHVRLYTCGSIFEEFGTKKIRRGGGGGTTIYKRIKNNGYTMSKRVRLLTRGGLAYMPILPAPGSAKCCQYLIPNIN